MERQANYALVGAISTLLLIAGVVFVVWLGGSRFSNEYDRYRIIFEGPVRGLSVGGDVQFNGIKMGQIERIRLDEDNPNRVITDISLQARTPVRRDFRHPPKRKAFPARVSSRSARAIRNSLSCARPSAPTGLLFEASRTPCRR